MYFGTLTNNSHYSSAEAPVNAGTYTVRFYLAPETNYELESDTVEANMTIERAAQTLDADPVSYTHLDVYKRQPLHRLGRQQYRPNPEPAIQRRYRNGRC